MVRGRVPFTAMPGITYCQPRRHYPLLRDGRLNKDFENVITLGMRGENDTAIMQHATLEENIQLIRAMC